MIRDVMNPDVRLPIRSDRADRADRAFDPPGGLKARHGSITLQWVEFQSDHDLLTDEESGWDPGGKKYRKPHWTWADGETSGSPVSHSMYGQVEVNVAVFYDAGAGPEELPVWLVGVASIGPGTDDTLELKGKPAILKRGMNLIECTSKKGFKAAVRRLDLAISWTFSGRDIESNWPPGPGRVYSGTVRSAHEVFVTIGKPRSTDPFDDGNRDKAITYWRMSFAVTVIEQLNTIDPHSIVEAMHGIFTSFELRNSVANAWLVAESASGVDCRSIVQYIKNVIEMVGCPGKAELVLVYPKLKDKDFPSGVVRFDLAAEPTSSDFEVVATAPPATGTRGGLDLPELIHPNGRHKAILFDVHGGQNAFEACLRFERAGLTRYYAGGSGVFATKEKVLSQTFDSFSWAKLDDKGTQDTKDDTMVPVAKIMPPWP